MQLESKRELLEWAARAAGVVIHSWHEEMPRVASGLNRLIYWNPLDDDGDEARLEAALALEVNWHGNFVSVGGYYEDYRSFDGDKQKARRMAGVRAAAEFGKTIDQVGKYT